MLDIATLRANPATFDQNWHRRGLSPHAERILDLDRQNRLLLTAVYDLQNQRNQLSEHFQQLTGDALIALKQQIATIKTQLDQKQTEQQTVGQQLDELLITLPNMLMDDVPDGADETENVELRRWGDIPQFDFEPQNHWDLGEMLGQMDFELSAKLSGARFVILRRGIARLHRALGQFMLDLHVTEHGFEEIDVPLMVHAGSMAATTHLPKFDNGFCTTDGHWLIPSAEVPLLNLYRDIVIDNKNTPIRMTALTPCFRSEAGSAGRDTRGMLRQHQFYKVELVTIVHPDQWQTEFAHTMHCAETVLQKLGLPYRLMQLCAGDCATKEAYAIDPEVWLPGQNTYREVCTWACTSDYQSRRAHIKMRDGKDKIHPYIIYGSGTAIGRTLIAVLENYQQADGSIVVPEVLRPYMGGLEIIKAG